MVRVKVYFKGSSNYLFKSNFDDHLSYSFHNKVISLFKDTKFDNFQFYTFSEFIIENFDSIGDNFLSKDGVVSFIISSVDEVFLRSLISAFVMNESLNYKDNELKLFKVIFLPKPDFSRCKSSFVTISPIFLDNCVVDGNLGDILGDILISNYCKYYNLTYCPYHCEFYSYKELYDSYVDCEENDIFFNYYYNMDIIIKGDYQLINFAYDTGLGNKNNQGFGMLDLY